MTKLKSKKMTKSTFAIIIMAIAMVAMLAFGGTYAYFTDVANIPSFAGTSTGTIALGDGTTFTATAALKNIVPSEKVFEEDLTLTIVDESNRAAYIFIEFDITAAAVTGEADKFVVSGLAGKTASVGGSTVDIQSIKIDLNETATPEDDSDDTTIYYILTEELDADENRELATRTYTISGLNATLDDSATNVWQNKAITISASVEIIQATGFEGDVEAAYKTARVAL